MALTGKGCFWSLNILTSADSVWRFDKASLVERLCVRVCVCAYAKYFLHTHTNTNTDSTFLDSRYKE